MPIRDFQAYDPGRYIWTAAWSRVLGHGLVDLRAACVAFQCLGLLAGLLAARRISRDWKFLTLIAVALALWMFPRFKVFEQSIALMAVYAGVLLAEKPTLRRHFAVGVFGGLAAFMGRNHGLYHLCAFGLLIVIAWRFQRGEPLGARLGVWATGIATGYLPQLFLFAFVPEYFGAFLALLHRNISIGSNVAIPIPWPWRRPMDHGGVYAIAWWLSGLFYLAIPGFLAFAAARILTLRRGDLARRAVFIAAACVTLPYAHHTFSRADWMHLAHSVPPLILGLVATAAFARRLVLHGVAIVLVFAGFGAMCIHFGALRAWSAFGLFKNDVTTEVAGETLRVPGYEARILDSASTISQRLAAAGEDILFLPHWPALYPATGRFSPVQHLYFTRPVPGLDDATIAQIEARNVRWVLLRDYRLDGREDLRFRQTNPGVFALLQTHFEPWPIEELPADTVLLRRKAAGSRNVESLLQVEHLRDTRPEADGLSEGAPGAVAVAALEASAGEEKERLRVVRLGLQ